MQWFMRYFADSQVIPLKVCVEDDCHLLAHQILAHTGETDLLAAVFVFAKVCSIVSTSKVEIEAIIASPLFTGKQK